MAQEKKTSLGIIVAKNDTKMQMQENEIVLYQPNDSIHLEVRMANESVWLTQPQIALLFGVQRPAITKHLPQYSSMSVATRVSRVNIWWR